MVGAVIGGAIYLWSGIASNLSVSHVFYTAVIVLLPIILTGGIHMDGFMDTTDALCSYQEREKKLEILKDPNSGAFAVIGCVGYYLLTYAVWYDVTRSELSVLAIGFILSRALSGLAVVTFPLAKNSGLAATFSNEAKKRLTRVVMIVILVLCTVGMLLLNRMLGAIGLIAALLSFIYYYRVSVKEFGGITGDLAGYFLQLCELVMALGIMLGGKLCG
jgi:adenosylcobinamide-GDP ribazoletransferase